MSGRGDPAQQARQFTVTVRYGASSPTRVPVTAETERDALLRVGLALGQTSAIAGQAGDISLWIVTGIHDPAASR